VPPLIKKESPEISKLALLKEGPKARLVCIYRVPEFVFFDHSVHTGAAVECQSVMARLQSGMFWRKKSQPA
jgi:hypothetical protein